MFNIHHKVFHFMYILKKTKKLILNLTLYMKEKTKVCMFLFNMIIILSYNVIPVIDTICIHYRKEIYIFLYVLSQSLKKSVVGSEKKYCKKNVTEKEKNKEKKKKEIIYK
ncbi:hypothetical protein RFI_14027 [Reticulomyxa filosa]|uniref:Uncharacterized protein n=1 Tax=Reticulomyxa filosa TaxID=46433 RepID=X6NAT5_RETFI|nr:hypothetical protein RFI_14027 [Reticulomyxa filosa]|eukprot:ETO23156.1 hypothetical protein RFI_14027 [Reticulomyxa filosa]